MKRILSFLLLFAFTACCGCVGELPFASVSDSGATSESSSKNDCAHTDADYNGICDACRESVLATFNFYAVNDLHGKIADTDSQPGVDELTTYLKDAQETQENVVVLSSGDMWQGSSESNFTKGKLTTEWMNDVGFVSMTMGNHEYDWGESYIEANAELAEFPFLAINVYDTATQSRVDYCEPSVMVEKNGVKIGIIGAIGDCYSSISSDKVQGVYFKVGSALTSLVKLEANKLRQAGAEYIVYSIHDGYEECYDTSLSNGYIDLVFEGHTHQGYVNQDAYGVYHLQAGGENKAISHAEVTINIANDTSNVTKAERIWASEYKQSASDPIVTELLEKYADEIEKGSLVLGQNARYRSSSTLCQKVAQLYYEAGVKKWGSKYDIVLGGGFFSPRSPYDLQAGEVVYADLYSIFPFDNPIVLCSIKGSDLLSKFINTDNNRYYIALGDYGNSIKDSIKSYETYYVVVDTYTSLYKYTCFKSSIFATKIAVKSDPLAFNETNLLC